MPRATMAFESFPSAEEPFGGHVETSNIWAEGSWVGARLKSQDGREGQ